MPKQVMNVAADDALTTIYRLAHDEEGEVIAARIAERLGLTAASVAGMLSRLAKQRLVQSDARKRISLTAEGLERAEQMVRRHRLAECLLVRVLGLEWWRAYEEAHLMEHSISDVTEPLIVAVLGAPTISPFGYPIPGSAHEHPLASRRVSDLREGVQATLARVYEEEEELLCFFDQEGMRPGALIHVLQYASYRGTMTVRVDDRAALVLGLEAARRLWVADA